MSVWDAGIGVSLLQLLLPLLLLCLPLLLPVPLQLQLPLLLLDAAATTTTEDDGFKVRCERRQRGSRKAQKNHPNGAQQKRKSRLIALRLRALIATCLVALNETLTATLNKLDDTLPI